MTEQELLSADLHHAEAAELAARNGWTHAHTEDKLAERWPGAPFGVGSMAKVHNVVRGNVEGVDVTAFEYRFFLHNAESQYDRRAMHHYLVLVAELGVNAPATCAVESEWGGHWAPRGSQVQLDHERFGQHYQVHSESPDFPAKVLDADTMDRILHRMRATEWRLEDGVLVAWGRDQHVHRDLESLLEALVPIASRVRAVAGAA